ncbi:hypothetical protein [Crocosphaera sp. XPORK-15E]|uniref:hypothetical protein n=1 Tax=Crocosphaera sp. XPORK-15E TaxID=3110247 RepID=UPI002B1FE2B6|nr:hypothetical protein [Crocosphaera sp. XPORK-15E]MEA5535045.1 hypothetical protein [Crocosphaera sp. XPORK-15E]
MSNTPLQVTTDLSEVLGQISQKLDKIDERLNHLEVGQARKVFYYLLLVCLLSIPSISIAPMIKLSFLMGNLRPKFCNSS